MNAEDDFDYWVEEAAAPERVSKSPLLVEIIDGIEPLGDQFGVDVPKKLPHALYEPLFGRPGPIQTAMMAQTENNLDEVPYLHTYAILDAGKVTNLPEMLETSGLEHMCMFKGAAYDDMKNVAPWIVRLEAGNIFTKNLFTRSDAPWHLWDTRPGIYLRSYKSLEQIWRHLRKFTKVQDKTGRWFYFRCWEPLTAQAFWASHKEDSDHLAWKFGESITAVFWQNQKSISSIWCPITYPSRVPPKHAIDAYRPLFRAARWDRFIARIADALDGEGRPFDAVPFASVKNICNAARKTGYRSEAAIWDVARAAILFEAASQNTDYEIQRAWDTVHTCSEAVAARRLLARARLIEIPEG